MKMKCRLSEPRYSNCCGALPLWKMDFDPNAEHKYVGRCSNCKDGAIFMTEDEIEDEDTIAFSKSLTEHERKNT